MRWNRREAIEIDQERAQVAEARKENRELLHRLADLVFTVRASTEQMESLLKEIIEEEGADERHDERDTDRPPGTDDVGGGAGPA